MTQFTYTSYHKVKTIEQVITQLEQLDVELTGTDLENLIAFNHTYLIITKNVYAKIGTGFFQRDELMRNIDVCFANYYVDALHNYLTNKPCPPAWQVLFDACKQNNTYQFIY